MDCLYDIVVRLSIVGFDKQLYGKQNNKKMYRAPKVIKTNAESVTPEMFLKKYAHSFTQVDERF